MLNAREWPGRGIYQDVRAMNDRERAIQLRKPEVVADAQSNLCPICSEACPCNPALETFRLAGWCVEMRLPIARNDFARAIDHDLRVEDALVRPLRHARDDT